MSVIPDEREIGWSNQLETLIASEGEKARGLSWLHQQCEALYNFKNNMIAIPVIVLSTLAGTASVGSSSLFPDDTKTGSIVIGLVSIGVGILNTISSYFSFSKKAEAHRIAYLTYNKLFTTVAVELALPREERASPEQILHQLRTTMERLEETTPSPPPSIIKKFNQHFKDEDKSISRPVQVNGLQKIVVFRNPLEVVTPKNISVKVDGETRSAERETGNSSG